MARKKTTCSTDGCDNEVHCLDMCQNCYSAARYWRGKSMKQVVRRSKQLKVFSARMDAMTPANVTHIRRRKAS